jgi:hypothetical protein
MHKTRQGGTAFIYWVNQNHTRKSCLKLSNGSGSLMDLIGKGGRIIVCHAGSATTELIPESKSIFHFKLKASTDYHNEMTSQTFKKWFEEQFLPCLLS